MEHRARFLHSRMLQRSENDLNDDNAGSVVLEGRTAADEPVFGLRCAWSLGDAQVTGAGDVFAYSVKKSTQKHLVATAAGVTGEIDIHAESGSVGSTGDRGCSQAPGVTPLALWFVLAALRRSRGAV